MVFRDGDYIKPFLKSRGMFAKSIDTIPDGLKYPDEIKSDFSAFLSSTREVSPENSVGFKGKIFLIVDDYVYSSAESFAVFAKATGLATIVGTRTGGDGIGIDPAICALPNSGLIISFPLEMGLNPDGTSNEETHTEPDIYAEQIYEDFIKYNEYKGGIINPYDTVINKVIEMTK
jgi:C-terminal processing protease CtpA/Prc